MPWAGAEPIAEAEIDSAISAETTLLGQADSAEAGAGVGRGAGDRHGGGELDSTGDDWGPAPAGNLAAEYSGKDEIVATAALAPPSSRRPRSRWC